MTLLPVKKEEVVISPYIDSGEFCIDIAVGEHSLPTAKVAITSLIDDYLMYNQEMFSSSIADANKNDALALCGILRLCAKRIEEATY
jgi:hypothetical protein